MPEAVGPVTVAEYDSSTLAITYIQAYPESFFTEVKFHRGPIYLSSFQHQIIGYVDVASRSRAGVAPSGLGVRRPTAGIEIVTPSDGTIALSVITTANEERVAIYQRIACDAPLTPSVTDMIVGARVLLNPEVYANNYPAVYRGGGIVSGLK